MHCQIAKACYILNNSIYTLLSFRSIQIVIWNQLFANVSYIFSTSILGQRYIKHSKKKKKNSMSWAHFGCNGWLRNQTWIDIDECKPLVWQKCPAKYHIGKKEGKHIYIYIYNAAKSRYSIRMVRQGHLTHNLKTY